MNFLVALTAAVAIAGPSAGPADLAIVGPTEGAPGQVVRLLVAGLPSLDPSATMGDGLKFLETIDVKTSTPTAAAEIQIRKRIGLSLSPLAWEMELEFTPPAPGAYVVVVDWNQPPYGLSIHRVEIRGPPGPAPPDDPEDPAPGPPSPEPEEPAPVPFSLAMYLYQRDQGAIPRGVQAALATIGKPQNGQIAIPFEVDQRPIPDRFSGAYDFGVEAGVPVLVVVRGAKQYAYRVETYDDVLKAVK